MQLHVAIACLDASVAGSLRQSLQMAVEGLIVQALGWVIRCTDVNFNLPLLFRQIPTDDSDYYVNSGQLSSSGSRILNTWLLVAGKVQPPEVS
jgi:hypothetical protein